MKFKKNQNLNFKEILNNAYKNEQKEKFNRSLRAVEFSEKVKSEKKPKIDEEKIKQFEEKIKSKAKERELL